MTTGQARAEWLRERRAAVEAQYDEEDGWGHRHVLVRSRQPCP